MFCCTLLYVHSSIAIILMGKRELVALLNLSSWCLVMFERLFLAVPRGCLRFVILVFPDHTHYFCSGFAGTTDQWSAGSDLVRDDDEVSTDTLCAMLGVQEVTAALRTRRLRWFGHVARSSSSINSITSMMIPSARRRGRPKKTWSECVKADMKMCSLGSVDPLNREAWGLGVRHSSHLLPTPVRGTPAAVEK